jgi:heptosyltransferase-3
MRRLLIRPGGIGDCITCLPVMEKLRTGYTEVWVPSVVLPLIQFADRVRSIAETGLDLLGLEGSEAPESLKENLAQFDSIVSWYGSNRSDFCDSVSRINPNCQFLPALPSADSPLHATDFHARNMGMPMGLVPRLRVEAREQRNSIAIHPFSGGVKKNWPLDRFHLLEKRLPVPVEWIAGPEDKIANAHRFDSLWELANWMGGVQAYLGNDSGVTHLAAAASVPTVALFGAGNAHIWRPRGERVKLVERSSMDEIGVEEVLEAVNCVIGDGGLDPAVSPASFSKK